MNNNIITDSVARTKFLEERNLQNRASMEIDFYNNEQLPYLEDKIKSMRTKPATTLKYAETLPITKTIIDEISILFDSGWSYGYNNDTDDSRLNEMVKKSELNSMLADINTYCNLNGSVGVFITSDNNNIKLKLLTRDQFMLEQSPKDPQKFISVYINNNSMEQTFSAVTPVNRYTKYTDELIEEFEVSFTSAKMINDPTTTKINPFGYIPFVLFTNSIPINNIYPIGINPLPSINNSINFELTRFNYVSDFQSFSSPVITNAASQGPIAFGPDVVIELSNPDGELSPDLKFVSPGTDLQGLNSLIENHISRAAKLSGLSAEFFKDKSSVTSGYQLKLSKGGLLKKLKRSKPIYEKRLLELLELMVKFHNIYNVSDYINPFYLEVAINDTNFEVSEIEQQQVLAAQLANGVISQVDYLMERDEISREEAEIKYAQIKMDNAPKIEAFGLLE